jgi:hypothetical protein
VGDKFLTTDVFAGREPQPQPEAEERPHIIDEDCWCEPLVVQVEALRSEVEALRQLLVDSGVKTEIPTSEDEIVGVPT